MINFKSTRLSLVAALIISALLLVSGLAFAQQEQGQSKSKIEQELEKKNNTPAAPKPTSSSKGRTAAHPRPRPARVTSADEYTVTFFSNMVGAEIWIDGEMIGKTNADRKLVAKVKKGQHKATASFKGYLSNMTNISVFSDRMTYTISVGKSIPEPTPTPMPVAEADPTPAPPPPPDADDVIKRFIDPVETGKLTADDWRQVVSQTEAALREEPLNDQFRGRLHLGRAQLFYMEGNYAESLSEFNRAITVLPRSGIAYYGQGNAYLATNQPVQASKSYQMAMDFTSDISALALKGIGDTLVQLDKPKEAGSTYQRARDHGYVSSEINKKLGLSLIKQKQWVKALAELSPIEGEDNTGEIKLYMGECYENLKRPLSAYKAYESAIKLAPNSPLAYARLGNLLYELNEFPEARDAFERALALDTTGSTINRQLLRKLADEAAQLAAK